MVARKKTKSKRPTAHETTFGDYVLVIEGSQGEPLATVLRSDYTRPPMRGDGVRIRESEVKPLADLAGHYIVHFVTHQPPPDGTVTLADYSVPWCYVRSGAYRSPRPNPSADEALPKPGERLDLEAIAGRGDLLTALAEDFRMLATELSEQRDEIAAAARASNGQLDLRLAERLHTLSRIAKQRFTELSLAPDAGPKDV